MVAACTGAGVVAETGSKASRSPRGSSAFPSFDGEVSGLSVGDKVFYAELLF